MCLPLISDQLLLFGAHHDSTISHDSSFFLKNMYVLLFSMTTPIMTPLSVDLQFNSPEALVKSPIVLVKGPLPSSLVTAIFPVVCAVQLLAWLSLTTWWATSLRMV